MQPMEAEKWAQYEERYRKYGLDLQPERAPRQRRKTKIIKKPDAKYIAQIKSIAIIAVIIFGMLSINWIAVTAFCADMQYQINNIEKTNTELTGEIENLQAQLKEKQNIGIAIDAGKASDMKLSTDKTRIILDKDDIPPEGFSEMLRDINYSSTN